MAIIFKKIIKNTTGTDIFLGEVGVQVPTLGQIEIDPINYGLWASVAILSTSELKDYIDAGDLVVNDSLSDLNAFYGMLHLRYTDSAFSQRFESDPERVNGFVSKTTQEAIEEAKDSASGTFQMVFNKTQSIGNTWLSYYGVANSHNNLGIIPFNCKLIGMTYSNVDSDSEIDLRIYKNNSVVYTWEIRNKLYAWQTDMTNYELSAGDKIDIYGAKVSSNKKPNKPTVVLVFQITDSQVGHGGGNA